MRRDDIGQVLGDEHVILGKGARRLGAADEGSVHSARYPERHDHLGLVSVLDEATGQIALEGPGQGCTATETAEDAGEDASLLAPA